MNKKLKKKILEEYYLSDIPPTARDFMDFVFEKAQENFNKKIDELKKKSIFISGKYRMVDVKEIDKIFSKEGVDCK